MKTKSDIQLLMGDNSIEMLQEINFRAVGLIDQTVVGTNTIMIYVSKRICLGYY